MRSPRVRSVSSHVREPIASGWQIATTRAGAIEDPAGLAAIASAAWLPAQVPGTAAGALRAAGVWSLDQPGASSAARDFDRDDWWWRTSVRADGTCVLGFDGLATLADVWLDGVHVLASASMFAQHEVPITVGAGDHELVIRCRALAPELAAKRPRPRWRVPMLEHQQLRWIRTTLLGRTPGWSPPCPAVGPWRGVWIEKRGKTSIGDVAIETKIETKLDGDAGVVEVAAELTGFAGGALVIAPIGFEGAAITAALTEGSDQRWRARAIVPNARRWWPHTHGEPARYAMSLQVSSGGGREQPSTIDLGATGFRTIEVDRGSDGGDFALRINGARVFCRGACWTPLDIATLSADPTAIRAAIAQARDAGMNMLRLSGTMTYADDALLDALDEAGILLWQDLMFANLDYPEDEAFTRAATAEAHRELARLAARPSLAVICGNSEVEQQAAMWGAERARWSPPLFHHELRAVASARCPDAVYVPSSATAGAFPHAANRGPSSYYGVGAYLRPLTDARRAEVKFASECLAFANVPNAGALPAGGALRVHHPAWKQRSPRDLGAGWDFDDVREHYLRELYGVDPAALRYSDHDRYLALSRATTGYVMAQTIGEWRRARSTCAGALIWWLRDLWPGAGWGIVDANGVAKPCLHALARAQQPIAVFVTDEGVNGLAIHAVNDRGTPLAARLELALYRGGDASVGAATRELTVPAHGAIELAAAELFDHFIDLAWAYRFGPPTAQVVRARLVATSAPDANVLAEAFHFPAGMPAREPDVGLSARAEPAPDGGHVVTIRARRFAHAIAIDAPGYIASDDCFDLAPGDERRVVLRGHGTLRGHISALNADATARIEI